MATSPALALLRPAWELRAAPLLLCDPPRDCRQASSLTPPRDPALLELLVHQADALAERYGWHAITRRQGRYGLKILAGCHDVGEPIKTNSVHTLGSRQIPPRRVLEVLRAVDGLLVDDHPDALTVLIGTQFTGLPSPMRQELQAWIDVLRHGGPRRRARPAPPKPDCATPPPSPRNSPPQSPNQSQVHPRNTFRNPEPNAFVVRKDSQ